jgi:multicomponent Na+:H+ antiporter subunit D
LAIIAVLMISSILNVVYLLSIPVQAFYMNPAEEGAKAQGAGGAPIQWGALKEAPILCLAPPLVTAAGAFALFFFADPLYNYLSPLIGGQ